MSDGTPSNVQPDLLVRRLEALFRGVLPIQVNSALKLAFRAHLGQFRDDGTPYVVHPLRVCCLLAEEMHLRDLKTLCTALLHDAIEDSAAVSLDEIATQCGPVIAELVRVLTKLPKQGKTRSEVNAEYLPTHHSVP